MLSLPLSHGPPGTTWSKRGADGEPIRPQTLQQLHAQLGHLSAETSRRAQSKVKDARARKETCVITTGFPKPLCSKTSPTPHLRRCGEAATHRMHILQGEALTSGGDPATRVPALSWPGVLRLGESAPQTAWA